MTDTHSNNRRRRMAREPKTDSNAQANPGAEQPSKSAPAKPATEKGPNKTEKVLSLLRKPGGATLDELVEVTGWLPHTTRAALTGLKKKGHTIGRSKVDSISRYVIVEAASQ